MENKPVNKKAQGMSIKVVIIAVLALIVMIVLVMIFTGKIKVFSSGASDTSDQFTGNKCELPGTNNECMSYADDCDGSYTSRTYDDCEAKGYDGCCFM